MPFAEPHSVVVWLFCVRLLSVEHVWFRVESTSSSWLISSRLHFLSSSSCYLNSSSSHISMVISCEFMTTYRGNLCLWNTLASYVVFYLCMLLNATNCTKVHKIFRTCKAHQGLFSMKVWPGIIAENFEENCKKTWNFHTCTYSRTMSLTMFACRGQKSRSNAHLVGHLLPVPHRFRHAEIRFRSKVKLQTVGTDRDFSVLSPQHLVCGVSSHLGPVIINYTNFWSACQISAKSVDGRPSGRD